MITDDMRAGAKIYARLIAPDNMEDHREYLWASRVAKYFNDFLPNDVVYDEYAGGTREIEVIVHPVIVKYCERKEVWDLEFILFGPDVYDASFLGLEIVR